MTRKKLALEAPVSLGVAMGATTPDPGSPGVLVWSTTASCLLVWNGSNWVPPFPPSLSAVLDVRVATVANLNLASTLSALDGVTLANGDRVLVKNQTTASQNGLYGWSSGTSLLTRHYLMPSGIAVPRQLVMVSEGTTQEDSLWMMTSNGTPLVGTNSINYKTF